MKEADVVQATIGRRCREAREEAGFRKKAAFLRDLAEEGVSLDRSTFRRYESGLSDKDIPAKFVVAVAKLTNTDPAWLMVGTASPVHKRMGVARKLLEKALTKLNPQLSGEGSALNAARIARGANPEDPGREEERYG